MTRQEEFRRGWPSLLACGVGSGVSAAAILQYSLGAFVRPLSAEFGWTRADVGGLILCKSIATLIVVAPVGVLADRFGARRVAWISQMLLAAALASLSLLPGKLWAFYAGYTLAGTVGVGTMAMIWGKIIVAWFSTARGLALGLSTMLLSVVGSIIPTYVTWLIDHFGWRGGYVGLGLLPLVGLPLTVFVLRDSPTQRADSQRAAILGSPGDFTLREVLATLCFWQMATAFVLVAIGILGALIHVLPLLVDRGLDHTRAAAVAGLFGLAAACGRLVTGALLDRFKAERVIATVFLASAAACLILLLAGSNLLLSAVGIILIGFSGGAEADAMAYQAARFFGRTHFSAINGVLLAVTVGAGGLGPVLAGAAHDQTGTYDRAFWGGCGLFLVAAILIGTLRPPAVALRLAKVGNHSGV